MLSKLKESLGGGAIGVLIASLAVAGAVAMPATAQQVAGGPVATASQGLIQHVQRALQIGRFANRRSVRAIRVARAARREPGPQGPTGPQGPKGNDAQVGPLEDRIDDLEAQVAELETMLAGVSRETVDGNDTLRFSGMNVQVVNDTGTTDGTPNGLGNLIIGYSAQASPSADRDGSHYLVVGDRHEWTAHGGIIAGNQNTASGNWASVLGGARNTASGGGASVSGGLLNTASGGGASVSGGSNNRASGNWASVSGGRLNTAEGDADYSSILGGNGQSVSADDECHPACP